MRERTPSAELACWNQLKPSILKLRDFHDLSSKINTGLIKIFETIWPDSETAEDLPWEPFHTTTLQEIMNAKLSQRRFWICHENELLNNSNKNSKDIKTLRIIFMSYSFHGVAKTIDDWVLSSEFIIDWRDMMAKGYFRIKSVTNIFLSGWLLGIFWLSIRPWSNSLPKFWTLLWSSMNLKCWSLGSKTISSFTKESWIRWPNHQGIN